MTVPRASDPWGRVIRSSIVAKPGYVLCSCDFSQAELRTFGALSGETFLINAYANERDIHDEGALRMYGPEFTKEQRVKVKMFNFAYIYGGNEWSFAQDAGLPIEEARAFVREYDQMMPIGKQWKLEIYRQLLKQGYVETRFGRRRRFPLITDANTKDARKACVHFLVASTANDINLLAAADLVEMGWPVILTVHDSIFCEVPEEDADKCLHDMEERMLWQACKWVPEVKWKVDPEILVRWCEPPTLSEHGPVYIAPRK